METADKPDTKGGKSENANENAGEDKLHTPQLNIMTEEELEAQWDRQLRQKSEIKDQEEDEKSLKIKSDDQAENEQKVMDSPDVPNGAENARPSYSGFKLEPDSDQDKNEKAEQENQQAQDEEVDKINKNEAELSKQQQSQKDNSESPLSQSEESGNISK